MQADQWPPDDSPAAIHLRAVEQVIREMRARLHDPLTLHDLAEIARLSPFHFSRVFRQITGIPPGEFLAALRLDAAKRLLLTTDLDVTDICFEIGYSSLGSFTTRFTHLVGLSPRSLRRLAEDFVPPALALERNSAVQSPSVVQHATGLGGTICAPDAAARLVFVGLFPKPIPQVAPVACTLLLEPGPFQLVPVPDGRYYLLTAALPWSADPLNYMLPGGDLLVGRSAGPLVRQHGVWSGAPAVTLRPPRPTDPPILLFLPHLLVQALAPGSTALHRGV